MEAKTRLEQYELSAGVKGVIKTMKIWDDKSESYVNDDQYGYIVDPLPLYVEGVGRNPLVVKDEAERKAAQEIINKTPQSVIDSINN